MFNILALYEPYSEPKKKKKKKKKKRKKTVLNPPAAPPTDNMDIDFLDFIPIDNNVDDFDVDVQK